MAPRDTRRRRRRPAVVAGGCGRPLGGYTPCRPSRMPLSSALSERLEKKFSVLMYTRWCVPGGNKGAGCIWGWTREGRARLQRAEGWGGSVGLMAHQTPLSAADLRGRTLLRRK